MHDVLTSSVKDVVEDREGLEDVPPVLAFVVQTLVEHFNDFDEISSVSHKSSLDQLFLLDAQYKRGCSRTD